MEFNINQNMERLLPIVVALLISSCITQKKENQIQTKNDMKLINVLTVIKFENGDKVTPTNI